MSEFKFTTDGKALADALKRAGMTTAKEKDCPARLRARSGPRR